MSQEITGGCLCGATRFQITGSPGDASYCHCADCRRVTGSAFNVGVTVDWPAFAIIAGTPKGFTKLADSGNELTRYFCPECGSPLYGASPVHPDVVYVRAGAFDDPSVVKPTHQSWVCSAVPWSVIGALPAK